MPNTSWETDHGSFSDSFDFKLSFQAYKEREVCPSGFVSKRKRSWVLYSFSINLINGHLNPRKKFLKLNHDKGIHLDSLLSENKVFVIGNLL